MSKDKDIGYLLHKSDMAAKNDFTARLSEYGITPGQLTVIKEIYYHKGSKEESGISPACIADRIDCDRPTVSGIIDRMETQGLILRLQNPEDKRSCMIKLTEKAVENLNELNRINREHQERILDGFSEEETVLFKNFLHRVMDNFRKTE